MGKQHKRSEQTRFAQVRENSVNEDARTADFVISTEAVDTYRTVFLSSGWDLGRYQRNPVVTYQHDDMSSNPDVVIGTSEIRVENSELIGTVTFENAEDNPLAEKVFRKVKNNILRGASIRADVHEGRYGVEANNEDKDVLYFTRQDLLAWSIVVVQSNPDALSRNAQSLNEIKENIAPETPSGGEGPKGMSRYDAQLLINQNL